MAIDMTELKLIGLQGQLGGVAGSLRALVTVPREFPVNTIRSAVDAGGFGEILANAKAAQATAAAIDPGIGTAVQSGVVDALNAVRGDLDNGDMDHEEMAVQHVQMARSSAASLAEAIGQATGKQITVNK
jgi:hypothetical protein